jgi:RNA polymerase sigma factor (sigma-70 family)
MWSSVEGRRPNTSEEADHFPPSPQISTESLLARIRGGDVDARETLLARYITSLRRWAHGRLPTAARDLVDTDDLVQSTLYRALAHVEEFDNRGEGAFFAYLRRILLNQIRDEARRARRRPGHEALPDDLSGNDPSPLESLIGRERVAQYEAALARLIPSQREAVMLRFELGLRYREIAESMGLPSGNAARMLVTRGLVRLSEEMGG